MSGPGFDVVVHFSEPVPGIHPIDGGPFRADRHVFRAHHLWQDAADTRLVNAEDVTVAQWPTDLVDRVVWKPLATNGVATQQTRPAATASGPGAATAAPVDHTVPANAAANNGANNGASAAAAPVSHAGDQLAADAGDWIQPMTLKTSQDAVGAGSPRPTS